MKCLSDFDGIGTCKLALNRANVPITEFHSSEIDKYALLVSQTNHPKVIHRGSVLNIKLQRGEFDGIFAGSPCTGFSFGGKQLNFEDSQSKLFFEFLRHLDECQPKYFMLENTPMKKEYQDIITGYLGVKPILIDSSICSAQARKRLHWANFKINQPKFRDIKLRDILEDDPRELVKFSPKTQERLKKFQDIFNDPSVWGINYSSSGRGNGMVEDRITINPEKSYTLTKTGFTSRAITMIRTTKGFGHLTVKECTRLQGLPDEYLDCIPSDKAKACLGNGWQLDTVTSIFKDLKDHIDGKN